MRAVRVWRLGRHRQAVEPADGAFLWNDEVDRQLESLLRACGRARPIAGDVVVAGLHVFVPLVFRRPQRLDLGFQRGKLLFNFAKVGRIVHVLAGGDGGQLHGLHGVVAQADLASVLGVPDGLDRVRGRFDLVGVDGKACDAPDPGHGEVLAVLGETVAVAQAWVKIAKIADLLFVDCLDETFLGRVLYIDVVHQHHIIGARRGAQLGQHLLLGVEIVVHHLDAGLLLKHFQRPLFVGAVALPVQHMQLVAGSGCDVGGQGERKAGSHRQRGSDGAAGQSGHRGLLNGPEDGEARLPLCRTRT